MGPRGRPARPSSRGLATPVPGRRSVARRVGQTPRHRPLVPAAPAAPPSPRTPRGGRSRRVLHVGRLGCGVRGGVSGARGVRGGGVVSAFPRPACPALAATCRFCWRGGRFAPRPTPRGAGEGLFPPRARRGTRSLSPPPPRGLGEARGRSAGPPTGPMTAGRPRPPGRRGAAGTRSASRASARRAGTWRRTPPGARRPGKCTACPTSPRGSWRRGPKRTGSARRRTPRRCAGGSSTWSSTSTTPSSTPRATPAWR